MEAKRRIRAVHKFTGRTVNLYYNNIDEAVKRNKGLTDFEYV